MASPADATVVWFRDDLRVSDHPALHAARAAGGPLVLLYVFDDSGRAARRLGAASRWWLHHSLTALAASLEKRGAVLTIRRGDPVEVVPAVLRDAKAGHLAFNRRYAVGERAQDEAVAAAVRQQGAEVHDYTGSLLHEPGDVLTGEGERFGVFTPFFRALTRQGEPRSPYPAPAELSGLSHPVATQTIESLGLLPTDFDWTAGLAETWVPGEKGAHQRLDDFLHHRLERYADERDLPAAEASSRLSPSLKFGEVSPYQLWHRVREADASPAVKEKFLTELGWREFDYDLLAGREHLDTENVHRTFDRFPWADPDPRLIRAWQRGRTGYPLVDAGMRQLWHTGWMHNRVRMVTASFLIKNLRIDWRIGERWFWDTLVDADPANNAAQWQWVAGSGADAAPFFRVFNPVTQATKFDPDGEYIRRWVPELRGRQGKALHEPWTSDHTLLDEGGRAYPSPIVDLKASRQAALDAFDRMRH
ncbi:MAG TPA: deoxyribodipyrimidine photo-lyase [Amnibacterium sp.]|jgi:deoxyribodipyrimidine photo-lyase|uniref:cryptochrome/photolyase family protein n=1 Tax=Amnibacterium sp. TaxID=1872496 RepID=UPI002F95E750